MDLEQTLCDAYEGQIRIYARLLELLHDLYRCLEDDGELDAILRELQTHHDQLVASDTRLAEMRAAWLSLGKSPHDDLGATIERVSGLLHRLIPLSKSAEHAAHRQAARLTLLLDGAIRVRQMQQTYGCQVTPARSE